jgi:hypothetical protein
MVRRLKGRGRAEGTNGVGRQGVGDAESGEVLDRI